MLAVFIYILIVGLPWARTLPCSSCQALFPIFYSKIASYLAGSVNGNRQLLTLPPVKLHDVIVARTILEAATYIFVGYLMFLALFMSGVAEAVPYDLLRVLEGFGFAIAIGVGVGMINTDADSDRKPETLQDAQQIVRYGFGYAAHEKRKEHQIADKDVSRRLQSDRATINSWT